MARPLRAPPIRRRRRSLSPPRLVERMDLRDRRRRRPRPRRARGRALRGLTASDPPRRSSPSPILQARPTSLRGAPHRSARTLDDRHHRLDRRRPPGLGPSIRGDLYIERPARRSVSEMDPRPSPDPGHLEDSAAPRGAKSLRDLGNHPRRDHRLHRGGISPRGRAGRPGGLDVVWTRPPGHGDPDRGRSDEEDRRPHARGEGLRDISRGPLSLVSCHRLQRPALFLGHERGASPLLDDGRAPLRLERPGARPLRADGARGRAPRSRGDDPPR